MKSEDLREWVKKYPANSCLFTSDDAGMYVFLIIKGLVRLYRRSQTSGERFVGIVGPGDVLGEKVLVTPNYQHSLTARSVTPLEVIQFEPSELSVIESKIPDFKIRLLKTVTGRLEKANEFIRILQTRDPHERIVRYVLHYLTHNRFEADTTQPLVPAEIESVLQMEAGSVEPSLRSLVEQRALVEKDGGYLPSHTEVLQHQVTRFNQG